MIIEETIEFEIDENEDMLKISKIEELIKNRGINPIRYSLISMKNNKLKIGVTGLKKEM